MLDLIELAFGICLIQTAGSLLNGSFWQLLIAIALTVVGVEVIVHFANRRQRRRLMPYRWRCEICRKKKGHGFVAESSVEALTDQMRIDHMRAVHLLEP